jgi:phosphoribosylformimino-5-aminoimidazole carboxamide ribotide isomerase
VPERVLVIPSIDLEAGRSRVVFWPGAATGIGAPTDRPERIVERLVDHGARLVHLIDFDGARSGVPGNLEAVGAIASRSAVPLQLAGGVDSAEAIQLAFAAGATRVVLTTAIADRPDDLRACLAVAGDWLAVGLDPRPERLAAFPWRRPAPPTVEALVGELVGTGVNRFVLAHGGSEPDVDRVRSVARTYHGAEILVAGGVRDLDGIRRVRDTGAAGIILGEAILSGAIDLPAALEAAA